MKYKFPIPVSRGFKSDNEIVPQLTQSYKNSVNGFIFHSLISRVSYDDNSVEEYRPVYENDLVEFEIDQDKLDDLTSKITFGPKLNQWKWWLFGYDQILNTYNDVVFNSVLPYSSESYLGAPDQPWNELFVNTIDAMSNVDVDGVLHVTNTTQSNSTSEGAVIVDGGVGIAKNLNIGGNETLSGRLIQTNTTESVNITTGAIVTSGGIGVGRNISIGGNETLAGLYRSTNLTDSSNVSTGAVVIDGGLGVNKTAHIGGALFVHNLEYSNNLSLRHVSYDPASGNLSYGAEATMVLTASSNYTIPANIANHAVLLCNLSTQDIVIDLSTLPDGYILNVKKLDKTVHLVKLNVTLDGDSSPSIKSQYESLAILKSSGSYYLI